MKVAVCQSSHCTIVLLVSLAQHKANQMFLLNKCTAALKQLHLGEKEHCHSSDISVLLPARNLTGQMCFRCCMQGALQTLSQAPWNDKLRPLAADMHTTVRHAAERSLATAYTTVSAHKAAAALNMSVENATTHLRGLGWSVHPKGNMLDAPGAPSSLVSAASGFNALSSAATKASIGPSKAAMQPQSSRARQ